MGSCYLGDHIAGDYIHTDITCNTEESHRSKCPYTCFLYCNDNCGTYEQLTFTNYRKVSICLLNTDSFLVSCNYTCSNGQLNMHGVIFHFHRVTQVQSHLKLVYE